MYIYIYIYIYIYLNPKLKVLESSKIIFKSDAILENIRMKQSHLRISNVSIKKA